MGVLAWGLLMGLMGPMPLSLYLRPSARFAAPVQAGPSDLMIYQRYALGSENWRRDLDYRNGVGGKETQHSKFRRAAIRACPAATVERDGQDFSLSVTGSSDSRTLKSEGCVQRMSRSLPACSACSRVSNRWPLLAVSSAVLPVLPP